MQKTTNKGHGRIDIRECWSTSNPEYLALIRGFKNWSGLKSIAMVVCTRIISGKETKYVRFYITSLPSNAERILSAVRKHWAIENELHWTLDVAMNEDHSRVRKDRAPENFAVLRHVALNLLKQEKTAKVAFMPSNFKPLGTKIIYSGSSPQQFRCDCPARIIDRIIGFEISPLM